MSLFLSTTIIEHPQIDNLDKSMNFKISDLRVRAKITFLIDNLYSKLKNKNLSGFIGFKKKEFEGVLIFLERYETILEKSIISKL